MRYIFLIFALLIVLGLVVESWNKSPGAADLTEEGWHKTETIKYKTGFRPVASIANTGVVTRTVTIRNKFYVQEGLWQK